MGRASTIQEIGTVVSSLLSTRGAAWLKPLLPAVAEVLPWVAAPLIGQARWPIADPAVSASVVSLLTHANEAVREAMALSVASTADER
jgi:hypothetical protein